MAKTNGKTVPCTKRFSMKIESTHYYGCKRILSREQEIIVEFRERFSGTKNIAYVLHIETQVVRRHRQSIWSELVMLVPSSDQAEIPYFKNDMLSLFEDAQIDFITTVQAENDTRFPDENRPPANEKSVNLPTISIPHFTGAHTEWKQFHDVSNLSYTRMRNLPAVTNFSIYSAHWRERLVTWWHATMYVTTII